MTCLRCKNEQDMATCEWCMASRERRANLAATILAGALANPMLNNTFSFLSTNEREQMIDVSLVFADSLLRKVGL